MKFPSVFKSSKPKQFDYQPQYYDAELEALEEKKKLIEKINSGENPDAFKDSLIHELAENRRNSRMLSQSNLRRWMVLIIFVSLFAIFILLLLTI